MQEGSNQAPGATSGGTLLEVCCWRFGGCIRLSSTRSAIAFRAAKLSLGTSTLCRRFCECGIVRRYDPATGQYYNLSDLPEARTRGGADILGDSLYYIAGFTSGSDSGE